MSTKTARLKTLEEDETCVALVAAVVAAVLIPAVVVALKQGVAVLFG